MYGCRCLELPESTKLFPLILSKINSSVSFTDSKFGGYRNKESTARVCLYKEFKIPAIYTLEASFSGTSKGICNTPEVLKHIGRDICRALIPYFKLNVKFNIHLNNHKTENKSAFGICTTQSAKQWGEELLTELRRNSKLLVTGDISSEDESGSDSSPSSDNLSEAGMMKIFPDNIIRKKPEIIKKKKLIKDLSVKKTNLEINPANKHKMVKNWNIESKYMNKGSIQIHNPLRKSQLQSFKQKKERSAIHLPDIGMLESNGTTKNLCLNSLA